MKKYVYVVWKSYDGIGNLGCWYDDMKIKVFGNKKDAQNYFDNISQKEEVYCNIVKRAVQ